METEPVTDPEVITDPVTDPLMDELQLVFPVEWRPYSPFSTGGNGIINVIHEITLGDLLISTLLLALIVFVVISRIVRR